MINVSIFWYWEISMNKIASKCETVLENNNIHLLVMTIDYDLKFENYLCELCKKANKNKCFVKARKIPKYLRKKIDL